MASPKSNSNSKNPRVNTGNRGGAKSPQSHQNLILMGKGAYARTKPVNAAPWQGASDPKKPFDPIQAKKNREEGFC